MLVSNYTRPRSLLHSRVAKAPKRRFSPGEFFRKKSDKSLWCIMAAFRTVDNPHEWIYLLEERQNTEKPETALSRACQAISGSPVQRVFPNLLRNEMEATTILHQNGEYAHGDRSNVRNQRLLNEFTKIESDPQ